MLALSPTKPSLTGGPRCGRTICRPVPALVGIGERCAVWRVASCSLAGPLVAWALVSESQQVVGGPPGVPVVADEEDEIRHVHTPDGGGGGGGEGGDGGSCGSGAERDPPTPPFPRPPPGGVDGGERPPRRNPPHGARPVAFDDDEEDDEEDDGGSSDYVLAGDGSYEDYSLQVVAVNDGIADGYGRPPRLAPPDYFSRAEERRALNHRDPIWGFVLPHACRTDRGDRFWRPFRVHNDSRWSEAFSSSPAPVIEDARTVYNACAWVQTVHNGLLDAELDHLGGALTARELLN